MAEIGSDVPGVWALELSIPGEIQHLVFSPSAAESPSFKPKIHVLLFHQKIRKVLFHQKYLSQGFLLHFPCESLYMLSTNLLFLPLLLVFKEGGSFPSKATGVLENQASN